MGVEEVQLSPLLGFWMFFCFNFQINEEDSDDFGGLLICNEPTK